MQCIEHKQVFNNGFTREWGFKFELSLTAFNDYFELGVYINTGVHRHVFYVPSLKDKQHLWRKWIVKWKHETKYLKH